MNYKCPLCNNELNSDFSYKNSEYWCNQCISSGYYDYQFSFNKNDKIIYFYIMLDKNLCLFINDYEIGLCSANASETFIKLDNMKELILKINLNDPLNSSKIIYDKIKNLIIFK